MMGHHINRRFFPVLKNECIGDYTIWCTSCGARETPIGRVFQEKDGPWMLCGNCGARIPLEKDD